MRWIIRSSLRVRFLVIAAAVALMVFGAGQLENARTEAFPEFAPPRVEVQTITTGLSAEETEEFVTGPLEQTLNGVPELDIIRSTTVPQLSSIELIFNKGTDLLEARQVVQERLGHTDIAMTMNLYSHVTADMQRQAAEQLDAAIIAAS